MTKVTILGEEQGSEPKNKIEFVSLIDSNGDFHDATQAGDWENIQLLSQKYDGSPFDLMFAWNNNPNKGFLYLGHFNDGVV